MDNKFHLTHYDRCNYLSMLGLKSVHVNKRGHAMNNEQVGYLLLLSLCINGRKTTSKLSVRDPCLHLTGHTYTIVYHVYILCIQEMYA